MKTELHETMQDRYLERLRRRDDTIEELREEIKRLQEINRVADEVIEALKADIQRLYSLMGG